MRRKELSRNGNSLFLKIMDMKGEPVNIIYRAIDEVALKYELTYEQVMSILVNYREDCFQRALKEKYRSYVKQEEENET